MSDSTPKFVHLSESDARDVLFVEQATEEGIYDAIRNYRVYATGDKNLEHGYMVNDLPLGRNVEEVLRVLKSLQFTEKYGEVCPANWKEGAEGLKPTAVGVADYLGKHGQE